METFRHVPDFDAYEVNQPFVEFATPGGIPPGKIVLDKLDEKKSLLYSGVWMTYPSISSNLALTGGNMDCSAEIRIMDPRAQVSFEAQAQTFSQHYGFAVMTVKNNRVQLAAYNTQYEFSSGNEPLGVLKAISPLDSNPHEIGFRFTHERIYLRWDGQENDFEIPADKRGKVVNSARFKAVGRTTSGGIEVPMLYIRKMVITANS